MGSGASTRLTLESRLLLAFLRTDLDPCGIRELVERGPDWEAFMRKSERLGLAPLIHSGLRRAAGSIEVPKPVKEHLRHLYNREAIASLSLREALGTVRERFQHAELPIVALKGVALAALVYSSSALRPMADIDLLVQRHDLGKADVILRDAGFQRRAPAVSDLSLWSDPPFAVQYVRPQGYPPIKIQRHIVSDSMSALIPIDHLWERARSEQIGSAETLVLGWEDHLLHLALDASKRKRFIGQLRTLRDIGEVCKRYGGMIDWKRLVARASDYQVSKYLYFSLLLARNLVAADVPLGTLDDLRISSDLLPFEESLMLRVASTATVADKPSQGSLRAIHRIGLGLLDAYASRDKIGLVLREIGDSWKFGVLRSVEAFERFRKNSSGSGKANQLTSEIAISDSLADRSRIESTSSHNGHGGVARRDPELAVTYDQDATDGVGAQLQRIYSIYALSRSLHVKYVHTPLGRVGYQGLLPLLQRRTEGDFANRYNAFFRLPSDDFDLEGCRRIRVKNLTARIVEQYRKLANRTGGPVLLESSTASGYTDQNPASYLTVRAVSPYRGYRVTGPIRICIHLRRGDNSFTRHDQKYRLLPNSYYLRACGAVVDALRAQGASFVVRVHTEMPPRPYTLHPGIQGLYFDLSQPSTIDPNDFALEEFEALPNLEIALNAEPIAAIEDFATADVLVLSLSSFGYFGGLLNTRGLVVYAPWWHPPLPGWLVASEQGQLDTRQVTIRVAEHLKQRAQSEFSCEDSAGER